MNSKGLKILCLEDVEDDAIIIREMLSAEGLIFQFDHVSTESEFMDKLKSEKFDIILSDYNLPGFSGIAALLLSKKICPDVPFICISGTIGEDLAVELMHLGASDYIIKDKLSKLPVAIERALKEIEEHQSRVQAENSLMKSEARFRDIIMSSYDWVWEIDRNWKYCYTSDTIGNILGYTNEEVIGKSPFDFMPDDEKEIVGPVFSKIAVENGIIKDLENWNLHKDGHRVCLLTNGFPIIDDAGNLIGYRGVDKDITNRKLAEEEIRKLSRATEQSPVSVLITDLQGNITYANQTVIRLTGYSLEELKGNKPRILSSGEKPKVEYKNLWETISTGKEWKGEFHNKKKNGELYWESASISPILDEKGKMTHFLAVKEDITERKKLASDLIEAKVRAEASDKLKTAFLNNISHEVRTPLNGILGFSQIIIQPDIQQEDKESYLEILNESSERLVNTITNYMDISLIISGNMFVKSRPVDLHHSLDKIYQTFLPKCKTKNLEFIKQLPIDIMPLLICDQGLLEKALSHLLDNAIKFTFNGSITFGGNFHNSKFELFVKDTGSGIDPVAQSTVFQIFMQADVTNTRGYEGSGLGLSIAKGLVELMGGSIRMDSEKGKGSAFYITFPNVNSQSLELKSPVKTESRKNTSESPLILIAEDDDANSSFFKMVLEKNSFSYLLACNGREAIELCSTHPEISLILMDIKMPVMDGLEATRKIKEFRKDLPIIGVTAFAMTGDKEKALEAGCDEYLSKPVKSDLLLSIISKQLGIDKR
jgi:PAS domain S-box-containing protein